MSSHFFWAGAFRPKRAVQIEKRTSESCDHRQLIEFEGSLNPTSLTDHDDAVGHTDCGQQPEMGKNVDG